jgi:hypothetical protein
MFYVTSLILWILHFIHWNSAYVIPKNSALSLLHLQIHDKEIDGGEKVFKNIEMNVLNYLHSTMDTKPSE